MSHSHPVYVRFERRFQADVAAGRKPFALRKASRKHFVEIGDRLELAPPQGAAFATAVCTFRARITFTRDGLLRVVDPLHIGDGEDLGRLFEQAEQAMPHAAEYQLRLAKMDGFESWAKMFDYHAQHGQIENGRATREVIGWGDLKEAGAEEKGKDAASAWAQPSLVATANDILQAIAHYPPSAGEDDDELVSIRLGDLKSLQRAVTATAEAKAA